VSAPWNEFGYARELLGPETTFVSPNNDTLYVLAALDLRPGPLVLNVSDTAAGAAERRPAEAAQVAHEVDRRQLRGGLNAPRHSPGDGVAGDGGRCQRL
jgi:hypothetical protein